MYGHLFNQETKMFQIKLFQIILFQSVLFQTILLDLQKIKIMEAPFTFGRLAGTLDFTDREADSKYLTQNLKALTNTILISPRRWGKSSLVDKVTHTIREQDKDYLVVYIDVFNCRTEEDFYPKFASAILSATHSKFADFAKSATKYLSRFAPNIQMSDPLSTYEIKFGIDLKDKSLSFDEILDLPQTIAKEKRKKIIMCIDEFQTISEYEDAISFQRSLRAHWQRHQDVVYCLYGSKRRMMSEIFSDPLNPFYKFGDIIFLEKIAKSDWVPFLIKRFNDTGKTIEKNAAGSIADLTENHSYYVQQLAQLSWFRTENVCTKEIVMQAFMGLIDQLNMSFSMIIQSLTAKQIN